MLILRKDIIFAIRTLFALWPWIPRDLMSRVSHGMCPPLTDRPNTATVFNSGQILFLLPVLLRKKQSHSISRGTFNIWNSSSFSPLCLPVEFSNPFRIMFYAEMICMQFRQMNLGNHILTESIFYLYSLEWFGSGIFLEVFIPE